LENFAGCAVVISHDRWFLDRIATHILAFEGDSKVEFFDSKFVMITSDAKGFHWHTITNFKGDENVFFGTTSFQINRDRIQNENVKITNIASKSTFDKKQNAWKSWIDLEITNTSENTWFSEYATAIDLPEGAWISDYYLFVGKKKEMGILAEKKSAMWVFSNIRNENKDPGILYYQSANKVNFKFFPFSLFCNSKLLVLVSDFVCHFKFTCLPSIVPLINFLLCFAVLYCNEFGKQISFSL